MGVIFGIVTIILFCAPNSNSLHEELKKITLRALGLDAPLPQYQSYGHHYGHHHDHSHNHYGHAHHHNHYGRAHHHNHYGHAHHHDHHGHAHHHDHYGHAHHHDHYGHQHHYVHDHGHYHQLCGYDYKYKNGNPKWNAALEKLEVYKEEYGIKRRCLHYHHYYKHGYGPHHHHNHGHYRYGHHYDNDNYGYGFDHHIGHTNQTITAGIPVNPNYISITTSATPLAVENEEADLKEDSEKENSEENEVETEEGNDEKIVKKSRLEQAIQILED